MKYPYTNKELSWLAFNARVLQEAADSRVPLVERIRFLGIVSSNMDEFFRVRVATLRKLAQFDKKTRRFGGTDAKKLHKRVQEVVLEQHEQFEVVYRELLTELSRNRIYIVNEKQLNAEQSDYVRQFFQQEVRPKLCPIVLDENQKFPDLRDQFIYLAVIMTRGDSARRNKHALIEVPTDILPRLITLPQIGDSKYLILLDDVIRFGLVDVFNLFDFDSIEAFTIKLTRDAELEIDEDVSQSYIKKLSRSLKQRKDGSPVRFIFDAQMPRTFRTVLFQKLDLNDDQDTLVPGGRYHNFRDFMKFPDFGLKHLRYDSTPSLPHKDLAGNRSIFKVMQKRDILLHYPYQSFNHIIDLLREAAIDPNVRSIKMTIYRAARNSGVVNALINAARNGKHVAVVVELQARFDEEANIGWANRLREEGVKVIFGVPGLKVHAKLCLITRIDRGRRILHAVVGTGNFNEETATVYSDHALLTSHHGITKEVAKIFEFFENNYKTAEFRHLIVAPFDMRLKLIRLIRREAKSAREGHKAQIILKLNNLVDAEVINSLYDAGLAGVQVRLIVRGMFSMQPAIEGVSDNIEASSIIDKYLEHTRIFVFHNRGEPLYFISSGDIMTRNLDQRVEVTCPIYDPSIQRELQVFLRIQWADNVKARILDRDLKNEFRTSKDGETVRAQWAFYDFVKGQSREPDPATLKVVGRQS
ncbi:MAG: polyphosphate kinase 1 [Candidatus Zixiibacteriota bacterium]